MDLNRREDRGVRSAGGIPGAGAHRFIGAVFGFVFAGIGLTVIVFLWSQDPSDFHSPPLFFKIFGSLVALIFVLVGGTMGVATVRGKGTASPPAVDSSSTTGPPQAARGYQCPHCAAPLGAKADVSPSGDVKCPFCGRWFNIHRSA